MTTKASWSVVVLFDTQETRQTAVDFCDQLVHRFWSSFAFEVIWWPMDKLKQHDSAQEASLRASQADLVIFALPSQGEIPLDVREWVESWVNRRGEREGALVGLLGPEQRESFETAEAQCYLRHVALRAGMDYLTQVPQSISYRTPESLDYCGERAHQVTSVLDEILRQQTSRARLAR